MTTDHPSEIDLMAYIDGELDLDHRLQIEEQLARDPASAARVMSELRVKTALKLLSAANVRSGGKDPEQTRRLPAAPGRKWLRPFAWGGLGAGLTAALMTVLSWPHAAPSPPDYVVDAVASHRTAMLRAAMASQVESPVVDAHEILSSTKIPLPDLPADWRVTDVQLFPFDRGSALLIAVKTSAGEPLSIFAVHKRSRAPETPDAIRTGAESVAYWRKGDVSYALTGNDDPQDIDASAEALANFWRS